MLQSINKKYSRSKEIRAAIEVGVLPAGESFESIYEALMETKAPNVLEMFGFLSAVHNGVDLGVVSCQKVTQAFANYIVDSLQNSTTAPLDVFKYHASGTSAVAEDNTHTTLQAEVQNREIGTQAENAVNIFESVATIQYDATFGINEHALLSASSLGTMLDRSVTTATINVVDTDEIIWTYRLTVSAEA